MLDHAGLHIDVVRDLKRINSHITAIAYEVLATEEPLWLENKRA